MKDQNIVFRRAGLHTVRPTTRWAWAVVLGLAALSAAAGWPVRGPSASLQTAPEPASARSDTQDRPTTRT